VTDDTGAAPRRRMIGIETADGAGEIACLEFGPAGAKLGVLFLHANGFNAGTYRALLTPLARDMRILAVDLRGHGRTRLPAREAGHSWQVYADDMLALLRALGEMPAVLAGHSMGATTHLLALPRLRNVLPPDLALPRLLLIEPVLQPRGLYQPQPQWDTPIARGALRRRDGFASRQEAFTIYKGRGAFATWPDQVLHDYLDDGLRPGEGGQLFLACTPRWEAANFAHFGIADPYPALDDGRARIHILRAGEQSTCFYDAPANQLSVTLDTAEAATHFLPMERPDVVRAAILAAMDEETGGAAPGGSLY
jgi:pimeloyl-ACP methyl ester carboxylesterase